MRRTLAIVVAAVAFLAVSALLARWLTTEGRERDAVTGLLRAQARGDARAMLARLDGCAADARCAALARRNARRLRRPGRLEILRYDSATSYAIGAASGPTRVVWRVVGRGLPVVQCVEVRRGGSVLAGRSVTLRRLGAPIGRESSC
ncbi:MAG TPA: hypothetical protein VLA98_11595 [Solirubrobacteraceae bacterium]|nr:hypothetical protein [Solirubrobacteraceae bacterium]